MKRGIIQAVMARGGLLQLTLKDPGTQKVFVVHGDNGPTVRALADMFGHHIIKGHSLIVDELIGQEIGFELTDYGTLASISE